MSTKLFSEDSLLGRRSSRNRSGVPYARSAEVADKSPGQTVRMRALRFVIFGFTIRFGEGGTGELLSVVVLMLHNGLTSIADTIGSMQHFVVFLTVQVLFTELSGAAQPIACKGNVAINFDECARHPLELQPTT